MHAEGVQLAFHDTTALATRWRQEVAPGIMQCSMPRDMPSCPDTASGLKELEHEGKSYRVSDEGVLFDPPNPVPVGRWNPDTKVIEPAAGSLPGCPYPVLSFQSKTYMLMPDTAVLDPEAGNIVGFFNEQTRQIEFMPPISVSDLASAEERMRSRKVAAEDADLDTA